MILSSVPSVARAVALVRRAAGDGGLRGRGMAVRRRVRGWPDAAPVDRLAGAWRWRWRSTCSARPAHPGARFGFAPVLSVTLWLVLAVYMVESRLRAVARRASRARPGRDPAVVLLVAAFPGEIARAVRNRPGCRCTGCSASRRTGCFGRRVLHAWLLDAAERRMRLKTGGACRRRWASPAAPGAPDLPLRRGGFVVLSAALVLGAASAQHGAGTTRRCFRCWAGRRSRR